MSLVIEVEQHHRGGCIGSARRIEADTEASSIDEPCQGVLHGHPLQLDLHPRPLVDQGALVAHHIGQPSDDEQEHHDRGDDGGQRVDAGLPGLVKGGHEERHRGRDGECYRRWFEIWVST